MDARLETIHVELRAINRRLSRADKLEETVDDHENRLYALEAFQNANEKRLSEARAYRRIHRPTLVIAGLALLCGAVGTAAALANVL